MAANITAVIMIMMYPYNIQLPITPGWIEVSEVKYLIAQEHNSMTQPVQDSNLQPF